MHTLWLVVCVTLPSLSWGAIYPQSSAPTRMFVVDFTNFTDGESVLIATLAGVVAQRQPELYLLPSGQGGVSFWQNVTSKEYPTVSFDESLMHDARGVVAHFCDAIQGYYTYFNTSVSLAVSLCGVDRAVAVSVDTVAMLNSACPRAAFLGDAAKMDALDVFQKRAGEFSTSILVYQDPAKAAFLNDYAVFAKAFSHFEDLSKSPLSAAVFKHLEPNSALLGWGTENDLVQQSSKHGVFVHAADWASNLPVFTNLGLLPTPLAAAQKKQREATIRVKDASTSKHTVAFLMTDGDNIQWMINAFAQSAQWYGSPKRGSVPIGWTISPALATLAPPILNYLHATQTSNDSFVGAPSGLGYMYPTDYAPADMQGYSHITDLAMHGMHSSIVNVIDNVVDGKPSAASLELAQQDHIRSVLYYQYNDYAGLRGNITWAHGKPIIGGRFQLWHPQFNTAKQLAAKLNVQSTDVTSQDGYSLVPVNVWAESVDSIIECIGLLDMSRIQVVLPDELVDLVIKNLKKEQ